MEKQTGAGGKPVISVENLRTSFLSGDEYRPVVEGISFSIAPRETVAIVGESGSGKSVTALSLMRLLDRQRTRTEGSVRLGDKELLGLPEAEMRKVRGNEIAMIFQEPMTSLNPLLTVGHQIAEVLVRHRRISFSEAAAETIMLLEKVRIPAARSRFNDYPHQFSGGMRQRVMIAMALACRPGLLIADEPTTALDVTIQAQTLELIRTLQHEEGMSVLFITHDMGVVAEIADRTLVMYKGRLVESGTTEELFRAPVAPYTRALLSAVPHLGSMQGHHLPMRFPDIDRSTGLVGEVRETVDTVRPDRPVLDVRNLVTRFAIRSGPFGKLDGMVHAVENVSFQIRAGETLALVGESGCGKSTAGRSIMRLVEPLSGKVMIEDRNVLDMNQRDLRTVRKNVQMIFQDPYASLNPRIEVGSAIASPLLVHGLASRARAHEIAQDLLEQVGLERAMAHRYPHEFSGGQRQRICIARALALNPRLIVADEAVSALDVSVKAQIVNLMLELQEKMGLAYLFISHDMAVVERISHRVAVMYLGEIVEIGPRAEIFGNPRHPYTKKLISAVPVPDPARRQNRRAVANGELRNPVRPVGFVPPERTYLEVSPGHFVQAYDSAWNESA